MKIKKIPYKLSLWFLVAGASLTLGLLSFGGVLALGGAVAFWPILPLAYTAFLLSTAYEGEIYLTNITSSLKKLFKPNQIERQLAQECLRTNFPKLVESNAPQFFHDYASQLRLVHNFDDKHLDTLSLKRQKHATKTLSDMEKWFTQRLFTNNKAITPYQRHLETWLKSHKNTYQDKLKKRTYSFKIVKALCVFAGLFMGAGTTYLLMEAFATIPFLAALSLSLWPVIIVPLACIAGVAYGLLIYNATTDMIANKTVQKWMDTLRESAKNGINVTNILMITSFFAMLILTISLSICTAGTWWTVAKSTQPLFAWMKKLPSFIMSVMNPVISSASTFVFNAQNISETMSMLVKAMTPNTAEKPVKPPVVVEENFWQRINPIRLIIKITFTPIRYMLFLGHLISIGVTSDRVPGIPPVASAALGVVNEGFEDGHYFIDEEHQHNDDLQVLLNERLGTDGKHTHEDDLPTQALHIVFSPLYALSALWDMLFSQGNSGDLKELGFITAWKKARFGKPEVCVNFEDSCGHTNSVKVENTQPICSNATSKRKSTSKQESFRTWSTEHAIYLIERHKEKSLNNSWLTPDVAKQKCAELSLLQVNILASKQNSDINHHDIITRVEILCDKVALVIVSPDISEPRALASGIPLPNGRGSDTSGETMTKVVNVIDKHRFFTTNQDATTNTREFLNNLSTRISNTATETTT